MTVDKLALDTSALSTQAPSAGQKDTSAPGTQAHQCQACRHADTSTLGTQAPSAEHADPFHEATTQRGNGSETIFSRLESQTLF